MVRVGAANNEAQPLKRCIVIQAEALQEGIEAAAVAVVPELHSLDVEWCGSLTLRDRLYLVWRDEEEGRFAVDEAPDQPRAGDSIDSHSSARNPLH